MAKGTMVVANFFVRIQTKPNGESVIVCNLKSE